MSISSSDVGKVIGKGWFVHGHVSSKTALCV